MISDVAPPRNPNREGTTATATPAARQGEDVGRGRVPASGGGEAAQRPLGIFPKSSVKNRVVIDEKTGEIQRFRLDERRREYVQERDEETARTEARSGRYSLQGEARRLLRGQETPRGSAWRVVDCFRRRVAEDVAVLHSPKINRAHFGNLRICGSVWTCPVCAAKVGEHRKSEVVQACDTHKAAGGGLYMVTLTFAHKREDNVAELVKRLRSALTWFRMQSRYKKLVQYVDFVGLIRALEVTHGEANGWHPHVHELWLLKAPLSRAALRVVQSSLFELWRDACARAGLGLPNRKAGVTIIEAESAQEYVTKFGRDPKWGAASELTKAHVKRGRAKGRTPFDLLRESADGNLRAGLLFREFATAFFGSRQLFWSPGLKAAFGVAELSDEELAAMQEEEARLLVRVSAEQWRSVLAQPFDSRSLLLDLAERGGADAVTLYLDGLKPCPPSSSLGDSPERAGAGRKTRGGHAADTPPAKTLGSCLCAPAGTSLKPGLEPDERQASLPL